MWGEKKKLFRLGHIETFSGLAHKNTQKNHRIFRDNARVIYTKRSKFVKNEHARYTLGMKNGKNLERLITATSQARF